jgi:methyltransferase (TIGR00027 family)
MGKVPVSLSGAAETMLVTLHGRAVDARSPKPILADPMAVDAVERLDYDFTKTHLRKGADASVALRARHFDEWAREYLARRTSAVVLHLAAGLDTRYWRVSPGSAVDWYDVDFPEVVDLRRALYPKPANLHTLAASVTADGWLDQVPNDRPALVIAEGLTMYLKPEEGYELLRRVTEHFLGGEIVFDAFNAFGLRMERFNPAFQQAGTHFLWGVDDPGELERAVPKLRRKAIEAALYTEDAKRMAFSARLIATLIRPFPALRNISRYFRYEF